ncbi:hypothetical protein L603_004300000170 [Cellulosimicrobium cellulans J34]|nr:hypothetical protein L603_004300000170 [Cellulosimicrobium cellulans J34]SMF26389.1 hypothetical protein SAMN02744115_02340 [Cellulosimicrobium cellulans J1]
MPGDLTLNAYVLAADPAFLAASVSAYYDRMDRIVVSYDESATSWSGTPLPVDECLAVLERLDVDGKCELAPGRFWRPGEEPLANDTHQRQVALDQASEGADWVLQLDTDEVLPRPETFFEVLARADDAGATALDYPSRWLYARVGDAPGGGRYLEASTRFWRHVAGFPGPLAVRPGTRLECARQAPTAIRYRVDLRPWNTDPAQGPGSVVHEVVGIEDAVVHYSWVRPDEHMRRKFAWSGHSPVYTRPAVYRRWASRSRHPWLAALTTPLRSHPEWYRLTTVAPEASHG